MYLKLIGASNAQGRPLYRLDIIAITLSPLLLPQVDIVLDNSGYELFGDLCLAEVLLRSPHVSSVKFHMKSVPWFVSDVTDGDMTYMLDTLTGRVLFIATANHVCIIY